MKRLTRAAFLNRIYKLEQCGDTEAALEEARLYAASRCGARARRGTSCMRTALRNGRCPNHGGMSTGPRTLEGRLRAFANLKQYRGQLKVKLKALSPS